MKIYSRILKASPNTYLWSVQIKGKNIWITGASSGIGRALALQLSAECDYLVISARRSDRLEEVKSLCKNPEKVIVLTMDMANSSSIDAAVSKVKSELDKLDILVNNAGMSQRSYAVETSIDVDRRLMEVNYFGNIHLTKSCLAWMEEQKNSMLVSISSLSGNFGFFERSAYAASKFAAHGFYESLRLEEYEKGLEVLLVSPSFVNTEISQAALDGKGESNNKNDERLQEGISPEDCAKEIVKAIKGSKKEIVIGAKGRLAVFLHKCFPNFFFKLMLKQKP